MSTIYLDNAAMERYTEEEGSSINRGVCASALETGVHFDRVSCG